MLESWKGRVVEGETTLPKEVSIMYAEFTLSAGPGLQPYCTLYGYVDLDEDPTAYCDRIDKFARLGREDQKRALHLLEYGEK